MLRLWLGILLGCTLVQAAFAEPIGRVETVDGRMYLLSAFGSATDAKEYYVYAEGQFVPVSQVRQIARVGSGLYGEQYKVLMQNGRLLDANVGTLVYERSTYRDPADGSVGRGYSAVLKGRGSDGFVFTAFDPRTGREAAVELYTPSLLKQLVLWDEVTARVERQRLAERFPQRRSGENTAAK